MKKNNIQNYVKPYSNSIFTKDKYSHVYLNSDLIITFSSEKEILIFLSHLRREIDNLILVSNTTLIDIYKYYRTAWYYTNQIHFDNFKQIEENLNKIIKYQHSPNANFFIVSNLEGLLKNQIYLIDLICEVLKKNKLYLDYKILKSAKKRLLNEFNSFFDTLYKNNNIVLKKALF
ncbi:MAG: hypothetical protein WCO13_00630 [Bacteroidota bacterium]